MIHFRKKLVGAAIDIDPKYLETQPEPATIKEIKQPMLSL